MTRVPAIAMLTLLTGCTGAARAPREPAPDQPVLRVLTYNVNYGLAGDEATIDAIRAADADVVVLQETTPGWEERLREALSGRFPHMLFRHSSGAGGLAVLSRFPLHDLDYETLDDPASWFPAWRLVVDGPLGPVQVLAVHLRPPFSDSGSVLSGYLATRPVREREIEGHLELLDPALPTIVAGDFNERDGRALALLRARGFRSALPEFHGRARTWRWRTSVGEVSSQLDHVAYDARLEPLDARVLQAGSSDHLPVLVVLALAGPNG
jgi:endonuclease/exonuclease/phosphatase (EEP) superfamily protein YafD